MEMAFWSPLSAEITPEILLYRMECRLYIVQSVRKDQCGSTTTVLIIPLLIKFRHLTVAGGGGGPALIAVGDDPSAVASILFN